MEIDVATEVLMRGIYSYMVVKTLKGHQPLAYPNEKIHMNV